MKIKIIRIDGQAALVEFIDDGMPRRVSVPLTAIENGEISEEMASMGIDHGVEWAELTPITQITPTAVQAALRNANIWTKADFMNNPQVIIGILKSLYGLEYATLASAVKTAKEI